VEGNLAASQEAVHAEAEGVLGGERGDRGRKLERIRGRIREKAPVGEKEEGSGG
jgi:hypothetical protein